MPDLPFSRLAKTVVAWGPMQVVATKSRDAGPTDTVVLPRRTVQSVA